MNTKVEKALGVLERVADNDSSAGYDGLAAQMNEARTTLAAHLAQQDATIAQLTADLARVKNLVSRLAYSGERGVEEILPGEIDEDKGDQYARGFNDYRQRAIAALRAQPAGGGEWHTIVAPSGYLPATPPESGGQGDYPEFDATDAAHPAWWRGHHHTSKVFCQKVNEILDGKDDGAGMANEPWESTRRRLIALAQGSGNGR